MDNLLLLEELFDPKKLTIIKLFLAEKQREFYLREVAKLTNVPAATTYRILNKLLKLKIINEIKISKFKLYIYNDNENTKFLDSFLRREKQVLQIFVEKLKEINNIEEVILHGRELKDRANILIIGENIDPNLINSICNEINEKYNFKITSLTLAKEQYKQMSTMGLYSGNKRVIFSKN